MIWEYNIGDQDKIRIHDIHVMQNNYVFGIFSFIGVEVLFTALQMKQRPPHFPQKGEYKQHENQGAPRFLCPYGYCVANSLLKSG